MRALRFDDVGLELYRRPRKRRRGRIGEIRANVRLKSFWALRNVSFSVEKGEAVAVIGSRGSGRTCLLRVASGTLLPDEGRMISTQPVLPMVNLSRALSAKFTPRRNIHLLGGLLGMGREEIAEKLPEIAEFAGVSGILDRHGSRLGKAMRQRIVFAVGLSSSRPTLVIDDGLVTGNEAFKERCYERLAQLREEGRTFLVVSDVSRDLRWFCDRAVYLRDGTVADSGSVDDMLALLRAERRS